MKKLTRSSKHLGVIAGLALAACGSVAGDDAWFDDQGLTGVEAFIQRPSWSNGSCAPGCGVNAECVNSTCQCFDGFTGDPLVQCEIPRGKVFLDADIYPRSFGCPNIEDVTKARQCWKGVVDCQASAGLASNRVFEVRDYCFDGSCTTGIILMFSGNAGEGFLASAIRAEHIAMLNDLHAAGFRTLEISWAKNDCEDEGDNDDGCSWIKAALGEDAGLVRLGCSPATVMEWAATEFTSAPLCAYGNSGGAAQIAYSLVSFGVEQFLDAALLSGGPPTYLEANCLSTFTEDIPDGFVNIGKRKLVDSSFGYPFADCDPETEVCGPCVEQDSSWTARFQKETVALLNRDYDYGTMALAFAYGAGDYATWLGDQYRDRIIGNPPERTIVPGAGHVLHNSVTGAQWIADRLAGIGEFTGNPLCH